jgi:hypothetical protein
MCINEVSESKKLDEMLNAHFCVASIGLQHLCDQRAIDQHSDGVQGNSRSDIVWHCWWQVVQSGHGVPHGHVLRDQSRRRRSAHHLRNQHGIPQ